MIYFLLRGAPIVANIKLDEESFMKTQVINDKIKINYIGVEVVTFEKEINETN